LLLEAGGKDNWIWIHIPVGYLYCIGNPRTDWCYHTQVESGLAVAPFCMREAEYSVDARQSTR